MFDTTVIGLIPLSQLFILYFTIKKTGRIIHIGSQIGRELATSKSSVSSATKLAVLEFTNSLRLEPTNKNIFVTVVHTGPAATDFFRLADFSGKYLKNVDSFILKSEIVARKTGAIIDKKSHEHSFFHEYRDENLSNYATSN